MLETQTFPRPSSYFKIAYLFKVHDGGNKRKKTLKAKGNMREGKGKSSLLLKKAENYNHPWPHVSSLRISFFFFWLFANQSGILLWDTK